MISTLIINATLKRNTHVNMSTIPSEFFLTLQLHYKPQNTNSVWRQWCHSKTKKNSKSLNEKKVGKILTGGLSSRYNSWGWSRPFRGALPCTSSDRTVRLIPWVGERRERGTDGETRSVTRTRKVAVRQRRASGRPQVSLRLFGLISSDSRRRTSFMDLGKY